MCRGREKKFIMKGTIQTINVKTTNQVKVCQPGLQHVVGDGFHIHNLFSAKALNRL